MIVTVAQKVIVSNLLIALLQLHVYSEMVVCITIRRGSTANKTTVDLSLSEQVLLNHILIQTRGEPL